MPIEFTIKEKQPKLRLPKKSEFKVLYKTGKEEYQILTFVEGDPIDPLVELFH